MKKNWREAKAKSCALVVLAASLAGCGTIYERQSSAARAFANEKNYEAAAREYEAVAERFARAGDPYRQAPAWADAAKNWTLAKNVDCPADVPPATAHCQDLAAREAHAKEMSAKTWSTSLAARKQNEEQRAQASGRPTGSSSLALLGAVAQGAAMAGGKNAAQLSALGSAMQGNTSSAAQMAAIAGSTRQSQLSSTKQTPPSDSYPTPMSSARSSGAPGTANASGAGTSGPIDEANVNQCVSFGSDRTFMYLVNQCNFKIAVNFCFTGAAVRSSNCARGDHGLEWVPPNGRSTIAGPMIEGPAQYNRHWYACRDGARSQVTASANGLSGRCVRIASSR